MDPISRKTTILLSATISLALASPWGVLAAPNTKYLACRQACDGTYHDHQHGCFARELAGRKGVGVEVIRKIQDTCGNEHHACIMACQRDAGMLPPGTR